MSGLGAQHLKVGIFLAVRSNARVTQQQFRA